MLVTDRLELGWGRVLPSILQTEAAECGLACLAMVLGFFGHHTDLSDLRRKFSLSLRGMNAAQLVEAAGRVDLTCRALRVELDRLNQLAMPAILHWEFNHFVVLKRVTPRHVHIHDPAVGPRRLTLEDVSKGFTGVAFELAPSLPFRKRRLKPRLSLRATIGKIHGLKRSLLQILMLALVLEAFTLAGPWLTQWIIDDALVSGDGDLLTVIALALLLLGVVRVAVGAVRSWVIVHLSTTLNLQWSANTMDHLLRLPVSYFEKRHMGDVLSRFGATSVIQQTVTTGFVSAVLDGLLATATLAMMFLYDVALAAIVVVAVMLYALLRTLRYEALRSVSEGQIVRMAKLQTRLMETIHGIETIKLFNRQPDRKARYVKLSVDVANTGVAVQRLTLAFQAVNGLLVAAEGAFVLWLGSRSVLGGALTVGMLVAFVSYKDQFTTRVCSLIDRAIEFAMLRIHTERLSDIVLTPPEADQSFEMAGDQQIEASIELRNVRFRYSEGEPWIIDGLSLTIDSGDSVALAGPSGCGKTTLIKLMLGLLEPEEGEVLIGGIPLARLGLRRYRELVGTVMQSDRLFAGSLADNITFFDAVPDHTRLAACAKAACIHDTILKMPMGYHTLVGDMGNALSGGQVQRVLLARALYKRPRVLFLDEATSHLDAALEREISACVARLGLTRIIVAHRPETVRSCNRVIDLGECVAGSRPAGGHRSGDVGRRLYPSTANDTTGT